MLTKSACLDQIAYLNRHTQELCEKIAKLEMLRDADAAEIGSYTYNTGLRGQWKVMNERIYELEGALDPFTQDRAFHIGDIERAKAVLNAVTCDCGSRDIDVSVGGVHVCNQCDEEWSY
jgi:uncharacterized protein (DUF2164 family)